MRQLRDNEIVIALIAGQMFQGTGGNCFDEGDVERAAWKAEAIVAEVIRRGDAAESQ